MNFWLTWYRLLCSFQVNDSRRRTDSYRVLISAGFTVRRRKRRGEQPDVRLGIERRALAAITAFLQQQPGAIPVVADPG